MTIWIGKPPGPPGNAGRLKAKALTPEISESFAWTSGFRAIAERLRWSQGLSSMPEMPWLGDGVPLSTKRRSVSGNEAKALSSWAP